MQEEIQCSESTGIYWTESGQGETVPEPDRIGSFVNASYLSRIFKQSVGESITKYIMRKRVEKSMELFDTTDLKVYEVAAAVGMPDAHYFGTSFKKYTGKTVNEYKSKNRTLSGK